MTSPSPAEPAELDEYGEDRSFVLVDATTGETLSSATRPDTDSAIGGSNTGRISQTALLAADISNEQLPADALDPERTASELVLWDMETGDERWREGLGLVTLEAAAAAAAAGTPAVVGRRGGSIDTVVPGQTGCITEPGAPDALAEVLRRLARGPEETAQVGARAREFVREEHSFSAFARRVRAGLAEPVS